MRKLILLPIFLLFFGCTSHYYNIPTESVAQIKSLGVVPIMVDPDSDIGHPQKEQLVSIVAEANRKYETQLVRKLKETGSFYTVAMVSGEAQQLFGSLFRRKEKRNDASVEYNKYFWKENEVVDYLKNNRLDALMLVVVSGVNRSDKVTSTNMLSSLSTDYNFLIMTAQLIDINGSVIWEYPNFRKPSNYYTPMLNLQYPDFSESSANMAKGTVVKYKSLEGIKRALDKKKKDLLFREKQESEVYNKQFSDMTAYIEFDPEKLKKEAQERKRSAEQTAKEAEAAKKANR